MNDKARSILDLIGMMRLAPEHFPFALPEMLRRAADVLDASRPHDAKQSELERFMLRAKGVPWSTPDPYQDLIDVITSPQQTKEPHCYPAPAPFADLISTKSIRPKVTPWPPKVSPYDERDILRRSIAQKPPGDMP